MVLLYFEGSVWLGRCKFFFKPNLAGCLVFWAEVNIDSKENT